MLCALALGAEAARNEGPQEPVHHLGDADGPDPRLDLDRRVDPGLAGAEGHVDEPDVPGDPLVVAAHSKPSSVRRIISS